MSDEKVLTERDAVLRERAAFRVGVDYGASNVDSRGLVHGEAHAGGCRWCTAEEKRRYPLPKLKRPRVVADPKSDQCEWSTELWHNGIRIIVYRLKWETPTVWRKVLNHSGTENDSGYVIEAERVKLWADLLATPSELVDDE